MTISGQNHRPNLDPFTCSQKYTKLATNGPVQPEGRPIVSDSGSETCNICEFIDFFLPPLACTHPCYIKDTYHFLSKVQYLTIPENSLLVTGDVTALCTNMEINQSLQAVKDIFQEFPMPGRPETEILGLLEIALRRKDFEFAGKYFLQICGTAMGKRFAPSLANIYLRKFDQHVREGTWFLRTTAASSMIYQLQDFENYMNTVLPGIEIILSHKRTNIEFLDTVIYKHNNHDGTATLHTKVFFKDTDTHQLLHVRSAHPKHTIKAILKSQLIRFKRICICKEELFQILKLRCYSQTLYRDLKQQIWHSDAYTQKRKDKEKDQNNLIKIWPIINYFDPVSTRLTYNSCRPKEIAHCTGSQ